MEKFIGEDGRLDLKALLSAISPVIWDKMRMWVWKIYLSPISEFFNDFIDKYFKN